MTVYKSYLKIVKKYIPMILLYTGIFLFFAVFASTVGNKSTSDFSQTKPKIAVVNKDEKTELLTGFESYLKKTAKIVPVKQGEESLKDALFFREVDEILIIPKSFTEEFLKGNILKIEVLKVPDSYTGKYTEMLLSKYLNTAQIYSKLGMDQQTITKNVTSDLKQTTKVTINEKENKSKLENANYFFNFTNYTLLAMIILIVGMVLATFNEETIKKRNQISPIPTKKINTILMIGNLSICTIIWLIYVLASIVLYGKTMFTENGLLLILNSFCFFLSTLSLAFLLGNIVKNREANSSIANVLSLGTSFICGAFVPQMLLSPAVLNLGKVFPSYWFIKNNDTIATINSFTGKNLNQILINMGIMLAFAILYFVILNLITKRKRNV